MPKNFIRKTYDRWIKKNHHRFLYRPWIAKSRKDAFVLMFDGLASELTCRIGKSGGSMFVHDSHGRYWDIISEFEVIEKRTVDGEYYCELCEDFCSPSPRYVTRTALWEEHIFEEMLAWVNEIQPDIQVCLYGSEEDPEVGYWVAQLLSKGSDKLKPEFHHTCFPAVRTKKESSE
ncbi:MAG: hypothetical protein J7K75_05380 [Desulfuromonas sp.]|nr:hypothetical protein [Desulfuromonas sp.]